MTEEVIAFTKIKLPYGWLGNMSHFPVVWQGQVWATSEHLFQAGRLPNDHPGRERIRKAAGGFAAKLVSREYVQDFMWEPTSPEDVAWMKEVLELKLQETPLLRVWLRETERKKIIEDVTSRAGKGSAMFWGAALINGKWVGQNILGELWMRLRGDS